MSRLLNLIPRHIFRGASPRVFGTMVHTRGKSDVPSLPPYLLDVPPTKTTALKNGIVVATEERPTETAAVGVWVNTGSGFETEENNGVAHFLEHMAFKGTSKRTQQALELEVENLGASLNAYTSREQTVYHARCFKTSVPACIDIIGDILQNSEHSDANIERERSTILREMEEVENNTEEAVFDHLHAAAFQGTPLGRSILGPAENIRAMTRKNLLDYVGLHYTGPRMVVAGAGGIKHEEFVSLVEKTFAGVSSVDHIKGTVHGEYTGSEIRIRNDDMPLAHVAIAVQGLGWTDPDFFVMLLIQTILGSWDRSVGGGANLSSRLCEAVATGKMAHSISCFNTCYAGTGLVGNYVIAPPDKLDAVVGEITEEWQRIANHVRPAEVDRAKNKLKAGLFMSLDNNQSIVEDIGRQMLAIGRRLPISEVFMRIIDITDADVRRVASKHFTDVSPTVVGFGPIDDLPDYNIIRGWTYWNRL